MLALVQLLPQPLLQLLERVLVRLLRHHPRPML